MPRAGRCDKPTMHGPHSREAAARDTRPLRPPTLPTLTSGCSCSAILSNAFSSSRVSWHCSAQWTEAAWQWECSAPMLSNGYRGLRNKWSRTPLAAGEGKSSWRQPDAAQHPSLNKRLAAPATQQATGCSHVVCIHRDHPGLAVCQLLVKVEVCRQVHKQARGGGSARRAGKGAPGARGIGTQEVYHGARRQPGKRDGKQEHQPCPLQLRQAVRRKGWRPSRRLPVRLTTPPSSGLSRCAWLRVARLQLAHTASAQAKFSSLARNMGVRRAAVESVFTQANDQR